MFIKSINHLLLFFWLFIGFITSMNSQNCFDSFLKKHKNKSYISPVKVDSLLENCQDPINIKIKIADHFSIYYRRKRKLDLAIRYAQKEIDYYKNIEEKDSKYENVLYNKGRFHYYNNEYDKAISLFEEIVDLKITSKTYCRALTQIGKCYEKKGDFFKAKNYYNKSINSFKQEDYARHLFNTYLYSINNNRLIGDRESTVSNMFLLNQIEELLEINKDIQAPHRYFILNFLNGNAYSSLLNLDYSSDSLRNKHFKKSKFFFTKALSTAKKIKDSTRIAVTHINLASIHITQEKDSALYYLQESLRYNNKNSYNKALSYNNLAYYYLSKKKLNLAIENIQKAINVNFSIDENLKNFTPSNLQLHLTEDKANTLLYLTNKAEILLDFFNSTKDNSFLKRIIETTQISNKLVDIILENSNELETKFLWRKEISQAYLLGTEAARLLGDYKTMFYFMERNKALLLIESIQQNSNLSDLPKRTSNRIKFFKRKIFELEDSIKDNSADSNSQKDSLFFIKKEFDIFNDSLKKHFPEYYSNSIYIESMDNIISSLSKNSVIVSYMSNKISNKTEFLLGLIISKNKTFSFKIENLEAFNKNLIQYKKLISQPLKSKNDFNTFKKVSNNLYNFFFPSYEIKEIIKNKELTIIPDISFENIPFESLNTDKTNLNYLINSSNINYAYSISFNKFNSKVERKASKDLALFAPITFHNDATNLEYTKHEAEAINKIMGGDLSIYEDASKHNFLNESSNYKIIHLATHASASNNPEIRFSHSTLPLREIYAYKTNADLVVLSACETNLGETKKGEGTLSLTRGFFNSGANSVVSTLWKINDASSSEIMQNFYQNLKDEQSKSEALSNAKRTYLKNHSLGEKAPYYWASFVLIGDTQPVFSNNYIVYVLIGLITLFFLVLFFFRRKKQ
ncbi:CHAT domain-containing protein [Tenacibaculum sp. 190130A14a]|uniref:CHAT domain-containing protein n=1 Tax=Tenacibaculum polynesiense TaxID=3137857 RepID=A0ABM9P7L0_9FLAO